MASLGCRGFVIVVEVVEDFGMVKGVGWLVWLIEGLNVKAFLLKC